MQGEVADSNTRREPMSTTEPAIPTSRLQTRLAGDVVLLKSNRPIVGGKPSPHL